MKTLLTGLLLLVTCAAVTAEPAPVDEPVLSVYTASKEENARRAVRLGYQNFKVRLNTPDMTQTDLQIAQLITNGFQPFFDKLNRLAQLPEDQRTADITALNQQFEELINQLAALCFKNQFRYTNPLLLSEEAMIRETVAIVQEAAARQTF